MVSKNTKSFNISKKIAKTFSIVLDGFIYATTLILRIRFKHPITFKGSAIINNPFTLSLRKIRINFTTKLRTGVVQTFNIKKVRISFLVREIKKFVLAIGIKTPITFSVKLRQRASLNVHIRGLIFTFSPTLASFFPLSYFDPQTLSSLDSLTIASMDYA